MKLDEYQQAFLDSPVNKDTVTSLIAVAGAGKTTCSVLKIKQIIEQDFAEPESIIFITFSNKSARDLANKYNSLTGFTTRPQMSTIHSLSLFLFRKYFSENVSLLNEWSSILLIREALTDLKFNEKYECPTKRELTSLARSVLNVSSFIKSNLLLEEEVTESVLKDFDYKNFDGVPFCNLSKQDFREAFLTYEKYKRNLKVMDYSDIVYLLWVRLTKDIQTLIQIRTDFPVIFVDEAQDLDLLLFNLIYLLSESKTLYLVYDTSQTIYGFRWAAPEMLQDRHLNQFFTNKQNYPLKYNYRSTKNIVDLGNRVRAIMNNDVLALPYREDIKGSISLSVLEANKAEGAQTANKILSLSGQYEYKDMAIISRTNNYLKTIIEPALSSAGIPYTLQTKNRKKLFDKPIIHAYFNFLSLIIESDQINSILDLATHVKGIGPATVDKLRMYSRMGKDIFAMSFSPAETKKIIQLQNLKNHLEPLSYQDLRAKDLVTVTDLIRDIIVHYFSPNFVTSPKEIDTINKTLSTMVFGYHDATGENDLRNIFRSILLDFTDIDTEKNDNSVSLMTVHGSKGLEFPVVFAGDQSRWSVADEDAFDSSCILYVQLSRAIDKLYMMHSRSYIDFKLDSRKSQYSAPYNKLIKQLGL